MPQPALARLSTASREALELPSLLRLIAELAATDLGRERLGALAPLADRATLAACQARWSEAARLLEGGGLVPSVETPLAPVAARLAGEHGEATGVDLLLLGTMLRVTREALGRVRTADPPVPALAELTAGLPDLAALERRLHRTLDRRGDVREDATPELAALRRRVRQVRDGLYEQLQGVLARNREHLAEETIPLRGGRLVLVYRAGSQGRAGGLVHGRSATGKSVYFEPLEAVEGNNRLQEALDDEASERSRILAELLAEVRQVQPEIERHFALVAELDALQAAYRFAALCDARLAETAAGAELRLVDARHPLLEPRLAALRERALGQAGHTGPVVSLDLDLGGPGAHALVVTGPNAGGKTVALKTVGLLSLAAQCGLPIPAGSGTRLPIFSTVVATVGDEQDLLAERSTFSGRLLRLNEAWQAAVPDALILLDELGSGTDPEEGAALAIALLETLVERRCLTFVTTHLTQVAARALELTGAWCAAMEFDPSTGQPTFHLLPGPPGGSEAIALGRRLGLPELWLARAEALLGGGYRDLRRLLHEVERLRGELAVEKGRMEREARELAAARGALEAETRELEIERRGLAARLKKDLEGFRRKVRDEIAGEVERLRAELASGRRRGLAAEAVERLFAAAPEPPAAEEQPGGEIVVGSAVKHRTLGWTGRLEKVDRGRAEVQIGGKRLRCALEELAPVGGEMPLGGQPAARSAPAADGGVPAMHRELNLIGQRVEPALDELDGYLDRALLAAVGEVRVVHGHGTGRLREAVRRHLRGHPAVASFRPGAVEEGGNGATVVELAVSG